MKLRATKLCLQLAVRQPVPVVIHVISDAGKLQADDAMSKSPRWTQERTLPRWQIRTRG